MHWVSRQGFAQYWEQADEEVPFKSAKHYRERYVLAALTARGKGGWM